ncbi:MAG: hypothetical protein L0206_16920 [Actinobacteria bacterium]|nr:hypothetical protein [Actinomycetota bacterium]
MKKAAFLVVVLAAATIAHGGITLPAPDPETPYEMTFPDPLGTIPFFAASGPPATVTVSGLGTFTFDEETGRYWNGSDSLDFSGPGASGVATFYDAPPPPQIGPPITHTGTYHPSL